MGINVKGQVFNGSVQNLILESVPNECPICHHTIHPTNMSNFLNPQRSIVQSLFRCTRDDCLEIFIATFRVTGGTMQGRKVCHFKQVAPIHPKPSGFSDSINEVSPTFIKIYDQALAAESHSLDQLVGIGLRKALEFLIKDFAMRQNGEDKKEGIEKSLLGVCINNYIADPNIKECAKRAAWLGNDETHYLRKWEDKDIKDLKVLVKLTVNWIDNVLLTEKYLEDMDQGKN